MSSVDQTLETIEAMCHQELSYQVHDYLGQRSSFGPLHECVMIDASCRSSMVQWCNNLVDFCQYQRETTSYAISFLDRYLSTPDGSMTLMEPEKFQLAAMCSLYTMAKIHERQALEPSSIARLSRGAHSATDVEQMETRMLKALTWRVNPPTALRFVHLYLDLIPLQILDETSRAAILDLVKYQLNLALFNYSLSLRKPSHLALAALLNAIDCQDGGGDFSILVEERMVNLLLSCDSNSLLDIRLALATEISLQSTSEPMRAILTAYPPTAHSHIPKHIHTNHAATTAGHNVNIRNDMGSPRIVACDMMM